MDSFIGSVSVITCILVALVTLLIGWQIYSSIEMEKRTHKIAEKVFNEKSEELRQAMYTIMCVNYNALFLTAMKTGRFYDALIYNDCKINCAIFSKNEEFAGDTIKGALTIVENMDKLDSHTIEYLEGHVKRLSKVMSTYPNLVDSYVYLLSTFENTHQCHVANRCTSQ